MSDEQAFVLFFTVFMAVAAWFWLDLLWPWDWKGDDRREERSEDNAG